jgi:hypothetical protein
VLRLLVIASVVPISPILVALMKEVLSSSETSVLTRVTLCNISGDAILYSHRREILKSYTALTDWALYRRRNVSPVKYELRFYIPEDDILHSHRREDFKSYTHFVSHILTMPNVHWTILWDRISRLSGLVYSVMSLYHRCHSFHCSFRLGLFKHN